MIIAGEWVAVGWVFPDRVWALLFTRDYEGGGWWVCLAVCLLQICGCPSDYLLGWCERE